MRAERRRKKKLTVAFHFFNKDQAGWNCEQCRRQGLERRRRCGFLAEEERGPARVVWTRGQTSAEECPKSLITPGSMELLEKYYVWKLAGGSWAEAAAREADGFMILENERRAGNGE